MLDIPLTEIFTRAVKESVQNNSEKFNYNLFFFYRGHPVVCHINIEG
jgi:hypothetical protein